MKQKKLPSRFNFRIIRLDNNVTRLSRRGRFESKADQQKERANVIAELVGLSITHNADYQDKLNHIELHRDQIAAHWNFREHDDGWALPFNAVAVASWLSHRIVLWEIEHGLGDV